MGIQIRRKVVEVGGSRYVAVPSGLRVGDEASIAGNRILLIDPRGEIDAALLLNFMEKYVEPFFWQWLSMTKAEEKMKRAEEKMKQAEAAMSKATTIEEETSK